MKLVKNPPPPSIGPDTTGEAVGNLQDALLLLIQKGRIRLPDEQRRDLEERLRGERRGPVYAVATLKLVTIFREQFQLPTSDFVDDRMAEVLNRLLQELGAFDVVSADVTRAVAGRLRRPDGGALLGYLVRAFHVAEQGAIRLGEDTTDAEGRYTIRYELLPGMTSVNLRVEAHDRDGAPVMASEVIRGARPLEFVDLAVPEPLQPLARVFGTVRDEHGEAMDGVTVQAFDRDLRGEELLGEVAVQGGHYEIRYQRSQFVAAEKDSADLVLKVVDQNGTALHKTSIHYNVPDEFNLDIALAGGSYRGPSEWESLKGTLTPLLENLTPLDLREDEQLQDFSFLAGETGSSPLAIATWAACFRLADKTAREQRALAPEVFFGFLRQGQPFVRYDTLLDDMRVPDRMALLEDKILRGIGAIAPSVQQSLLEAAVADNLVPARLAPQIEGILDVLRSIHLSYAAETTFGGGKGTIRQLLELTPAATQQQTAFMAVFTAHQGPIKTFWTKLTDDAVLPAEAVQRVRLSFEIGTLTRNHIPLVAEIIRRFERGDLTEKRELAKLAPADWKAVLSKPGPDGQVIGVPANMDGANAEARMEQFAAILEQQFERAYPTTSFSAKLARAEQSPLQSKAEVVRFLDNNPALQLDRMRVDHYLAENENALRGIEDRAKVIADLKSVQRVFKLNPTFKVVDALLSRNIDSSQQIYFMGERQFTKALSGTAVDKIEARQLYRRAENGYAYALAMFGDYNLALNGVAPFGVPSSAPDSATQAKIAALPNLQTLFGSLDYCECTDCRSVYSPAAYFVDVMRFLGARGTQGSTINAGKDVRQVLLERRPDLGEIELSCENTNTPLPYIDLVNEILEDVVAPPRPVPLSGGIEADMVAGPIKLSVRNELDTGKVAIAADARVYDPDIRGQWVIRDGQHAYKVRKSGIGLQLSPSRQTFLSAPELRANPEYTNDDAYAQLRTDVFPLNLPFDLWHLQVRTYLGHLGVQQPRLLELFQQKLADDVTLAPDSLQIDCAWLGITETERQILTGALPGKKAWEFWGLKETGNDLPNPEKPADPTENITGKWTDVLSSVNVMLNRTGLSYKELLQLLDMRYVNPTGSIFVFDTADPNAANCDTSGFIIRNLTEDPLNRMHRFIRLWRKLGCAMWELDLLLPDTSAAPGVIDKRINDAVLQDISRMDRLRRPSGLDWRVVQSLYRGIDHEIYVDRGRDGTPAVQTLYERLFRNKLVDAVASFPPSPEQITGTIADQVPGMVAAFRIKEAGLDLILADLGLLQATSIDVTILGRIYRVTVIAQSLGLDIDKFLRLKHLWAQDPFASPLATWEFAELAKRIAASRFTVLELDYLLAHRFTPSTGVALEDKPIVAFMEAIRDGLTKIDDGVRQKTEETKEAYVKTKLGLLPALGKDVDQVVALGIVDGTWEGSAAERAKLIAALFEGVVEPLVAGTKLAALPGGLSAAGRQDEVDKRFEYFQPALEVFLLKTQQEAFVGEKTAEVLRLDAPSTDALLRALHLPASADTLLQSITDQRLLDRLPDGTYRFALDEPTFPSIFKSLRLLHKLALIVGKLQMKAAEVRWWLDTTHAAEMGWMSPESFPIDDTTQLPIEQWVAIEQFFAWKEGLPKSDLTAFEFATQLIDPSRTSADAIRSLAKLTSWSEADIKRLAAAFHWHDPVTSLDVIKQELKKSSSLMRLAECMQGLRRLGVNAERGIQWATAQPGSAEADSLKQTVKAKYDLKQWLEVIQPIQDEFREQKRRNLVSWLVVRPDQAAGQSWSDPNGLYSYFLIDVEMCACMLTSRLKQAAASVQLFVQRCLLNLEVDILAKTDLDSKWKQWPWMKQYRVWEANRKVFLYPENWIEPELRDEKSPFFKDVETELVQNEVTNEVAEQAYLNYLEKLDKVANLEVRAFYNQVISQDESVLHAFARTRSSQGPEHYYRTRINVGRWTAWQNVELDITGNHLVAGVHNRRLYLLWPQFLPKADEPTGMTTPNAGSPTTIVQPTKYWEIRLFWSELKKGKWTPKVLSDSFVRVNQQDTGGDKTENVDFSARFGLYIPVTIVCSSDPATAAPTSANDFFGKVGKQINRYSFKSTSETFLAPTDSWYSNNLLKHSKTSHYFGHFSVGGGKIAATTKVNPQAHEASSEVLAKLNGETYSVINLQGGEATPRGSFFVWDTDHVYFVDYTRSEDRLYTSRGVRTTVSASFDFYIHYHPFIELFIKELNIWGVKGLLNRQIQIAPTTIPGSPATFNFADYKPTGRVTKRYRLPDGSLSYPIEDVDFTYLGAYAAYNWELFFHVPFFIANKLSANQRFEEALEWFHYIFDPTSTDNTVAEPDSPQQKFWITKPFYETTKAEYYKQKIENIMLAIAKGDIQLRKQVEEWRGNPFNPHLIARMRTVAYQKSLLIKYIQTLIAWGDQLFRRDTIETLNEATQLYILAASILGPRPKSVPRRTAIPVKNFYQLQKEGIDDFGNVLKEVENLLPSVSSAAAQGAAAPELPHLDVLYFCIPHNEKLLTLWDAVDDRLFKIRHCMNIEGVVRQLPLFEPPIDPALLVKAAAVGLDIGAALNDMNAPLPLYRFAYMIQRALEFCSEVKSLGTAMLTALEKRDAEAFALLRTGHERTMLERVRIIKAGQVDEALRAEEALGEAKKVVEERKAYYERLRKDGLSDWETASLALTGGAIVAETVGTVLNALGSGTSMIPEVNAGAAGFGGSPHMTLSLGGKSVTSALTKAAEVAKGLASILQMGAGMTTTIAAHNRRSEEWDFQQRLAERELPQIDKQRAAAGIRHEIAIQDLANQDKQIENAEKEDEYLRNKFTNQELYDWMLNQISTVYFQSYQLAYDIAKRAERCFRYELGLSDSSYVQFGYWDSLKKGLLSGERLHYDLKRLEASYYEQNRRDFELTKSISLEQLDPIALLKLRQNGECFVDVPEMLFDMDYPGHYFRRLKTVGLSIPCIAGPYTTVACTLTLTSNHLRKDSTLLSGKYARDTAIEDPRFRDEITGIQSIATSNAQNDHGMFELSFRDERYLPFEGAGAISSWRIKLNKALPQFDFATISDVVIHLSYTARDGGELSRSKAVEEFGKKMNELALAEARRGLFRVFDLKREYSSEWSRFLHPARPADDQALVLEGLADRLPYFTHQFASKKIRRVEVVGAMKDAANYKVALSPLGSAAGDLLTLSPDPTYEGLHRILKDLTGSELAFDTWTLKLKSDGAADFKSLPVDAARELFLIINYTIA